MCYYIHVLVISGKMYSKSNKDASMQSNMTDGHGKLYSDIILKQWQHIKMTKNGRETIEIDQTIYFVTGHTTMLGYVSEVLLMWMRERSVRDDFIYIIVPYKMFIWWLGSQICMSGIDRITIRCVSCFCLQQCREIHRKFLQELS